MGVLKRDKIDKPICSHSKQPTEIVHAEERLRPSGASERDFDWTMTSFPHPSCVTLPRRSHFNK
jgi:hypothetical protein